MVKFFFFIISVFIISTVVCCSSNKRLEEALTMAGDNRLELEKVLEYYKDSGLKYDAARFLIENMPGCIMVDSTFLENYQPVYRDYDSVIRTFNDDYIRFRDALGAVSYLSRKKRSTIMITYWRDINKLKSNQIIDEINLAFKAWKENIYTQNCSFKDFCEYILPYRRAQGLLIDTIRSHFYNLHHESFFKDRKRGLQLEADSLLYLYRDIKYEYEMDIPMYDPKMLEKFKYCICDHRCWFNSLLFSSLGMAVAIDFVPCWGNWSGSHTWNVLINEGDSYAFEPFWDEDRWKYKQIYNNIAIDSVWGGVRLPRVFRKTYANYYEDILLDNEISLSDIPELFRDYKKKDVSKEYFETTDIVIRLDDVPKNAKYCFLCVWDSPGWKPVQWGKIRFDRVTFKDMGRDIVYLPAYYSNGSLIPAGDPLLLKQDGSIRRITVGQGHERVTLRRVNGKVFYQNNNWKYIKSLDKMRFWGIKEEKSELLCQTTVDMVQAYQQWQVKCTTANRYVRIQLPTELFAMGSLDFYTSNGKIADYEITTFIEAEQKEEKVAFLLDQCGATTYSAHVPDKYVDIDLGQEYHLTAIGITPYCESSLKKGSTFTLKYWQDGGWHPVSSKMGNDSFLIFEEVPRNALLLLQRDKCDQYATKKNERIFTYKNGEIEWY